MRIVKMGLTAMYVVMILMAKALLVIHAQSCQGKCNIVFCGQTGLIGKTERLVARNLRQFCYEKNGFWCGSDCNLGMVYYKKKVYNDDVCPMVPRDKNNTEIKKQCDSMEAKYRHTKDAEVTANRLERCFERVNEDDELMARVDNNCKYTVVVLANARLTESDIPTLKTQAKRLKKNCAKILCFYVQGNDAKYDPTYDEICDEVRRADSTTASHPTHYFIEHVHEYIECCPSSSNGSASCCQT